MKHVNQSNTPFTALYTQWLDSFWAMIPGAKPAGASEELARKQEQVAANQEWEDEGGTVKPAKPLADAMPDVKIPF